VPSIQVSRSTGCRREGGTGGGSDTERWREGAACWEGGGSASEGGQLSRGRSPALSITYTNLHVHIFWRFSPVGAPPVLQTSK